MRRTITGAVLGVVLCAGVASAEELEGSEDPIATDRPDFVESSATVGLRRWQIETSMAWENDRDSGFKATAWSTPTLLRYGVADNWELRFETDGLIDARLRGPGLRLDENGMSDVSIGAKYHVPGSGEGGPSMAWLFHLDLDSGSRAFRGDGVRPSVRMVAEWELGNDIGIGMMPGLIYDNDGGDRFVAGIFGVVIGKGWTDRFRTFAEIALPQIARSDRGGTLATLDLGGAYLIGNNVQWDFAASLGLNDRTPDLGVTTGLSIRW